MLQLFLWLQFYIQIKIAITGIVLAIATYENRIFENNRRVKRFKRTIDCTIGIRKPDIEGSVSGKIIHLGHVITIIISIAGFNPFGVSYFNNDIANRLMVSFLANHS